MLALRMDDIGASSKQYEVYSTRLRGLGNILFIKRLPWFKAWGTYSEMTPDQWSRVFDILRKFDAKLTVAVTAAWVEEDGSLTPFPEKFSAQAERLKQALEEGLVEIANHGLTHCVVGQHMPRPFSSNRTFHREFWDWLDDEVHFRHIERSQKILQDYFQTSITTLVPPGNVYTDATIHAAKKFGINRINCHNPRIRDNDIRILSDEHVLAFHDRELVLEGVQWLRRKLAERQDTQYCFVKDL